MASLNDGLGKPITKLLDLWGLTPSQQLNILGLPSTNDTVLYELREGK